MHKNTHHGNILSHHSIYLYTYFLYEIIWKQLQLVKMREIIFINIVSCLFIHIYLLYIFQKIILLLQLMTKMNTTVSQNNDILKTMIY